MREILFRGKRADNGEWIEGNLFIPDRADTPTEICIGTNIVRITYDVIPETVGQYTGLTDKNGTKIFEGDIVKSVYSLKQANGVLEREIRSSIEYGVGWAYSEVYGVLQRFRDGSGVALLSLMKGTEVADCEVIGNIHDNPELLKEREKV